jgi:hypothetical protein
VPVAGRRRPVRPGNPQATAIAPTGCRPIVEVPVEDPAHILDVAQGPPSIAVHDLGVVPKDVRQSGAPWRLVVLDANQSQGGTGEVAR